MTRAGRGRAGWRAVPDLAERSRTFRLVAAVLAGISLAFVAEWGAQALAPTTTERGVVTASSVELGGGRRDSDEYTVRARLDSGRTVDLRERNAVDVLAATRPGRPVLVTRSTLDGQVLAIRTPAEAVDTRDYAGAWILRATALLLAGAGTWLALRSADPWAGAVLVAAAAAFGAHLWTGPELARTDDPPPGMQIYDDPRHFPQRTAAVGQAVTVQGVTVTVTGPPLPGLPAGAGPGLAGFATVTLPLRSDAPLGRYVPMRLIGDGAGYAELLRAPAPCGGAPGAFPDDVPAGVAEGPLCAVVPTGFEPRFLVVGTAGPDQVAVALR